MSPEAGRRFGPYQIQGRLGGGGMGHVFRAWDARLHREVAIKMLHDEFSMPGMRERFLREARAASALNHPHICSVFDIGEQDGEPYFVMELLQGETLKDRIQRGNITADDLVCVGREVAEALAAAHSKGVIHRDIKPANIFLVDKPNGKIQSKVLDFGLAKIEGGALGARQRSRDITSAGATVGTLAYMSPEQARGEVLDSRSDLFSLGVVLYEMATRQVPFQGATSALVFVKLLNHPPAPVRDWNESIPRELEKIIFRLMAKERTARFQTAQELDDALARMSEKSPGGGWLRKAVSTVPLVRVPEPIARERRASRKLTRESSTSADLPGPVTSPGTSPAGAPGSFPAGPAANGQQSNGPATRVAAHRGTSTAVSEPDGSRSRTSGERTSDRMPDRSPAPPSTPSQPVQLLRPVARIPRDDTPQPQNADASSPAGPGAGQARVSTRTGHSAAEAAPDDPDSGDFGQLGLQAEVQAGARSGIEQAGEPGIATASRPDKPVSLSAQASSVAAEESRSPQAGRPSKAPADWNHSDAGRSASGVFDRDADLFEKDDAFAGAGPYDASAGLELLDENEMVFAGPARRERKETVFRGANQTGEARPATRGSRSARTAAIVIAGLAVLLIAFVFYRNRGHFGPAALTPEDRVLLTRIENQTGDKVLDGTLTEGLALALRQSPYLRMVSGEAFRSAARVSGISPADPITVVQARGIASKLGTRAYLYGSVKGSSAPYTLHVDLLATSSNDVIASIDERAESLQQVPAALDRVSDAIRASAGEDSETITSAHVALNQEATGNLDALHAFSLGEEGYSAGRSVEALGQYQRAVQLEPSFLEAHLRLVTLYRRLHAEVAEAEEARLALAASSHASPRLKNTAQYQYEISVSGDYARALAIERQMLKDRPSDAETLAAYALVERLLGRLPDALQSSQQAYNEDPWSLEAYVEAQSVLVALDRYDAALQIAEQSQRMGLQWTAGGLIPAYLEGRQEMLARAEAEYEAARPGQRTDWRFGLYLDNAGRLTEGLALWRGNAAGVAKVNGLASAASFLLAQGALDRALLGDCSNALALAGEASANPEGLHAVFNSGISRALCHQPAEAQAAISTLEREYPQSTEVKEYLVPDLQGAIALAANDPAAALEALKPARQFDLLSLTPYLRGLCHVALRQVQIGIVDFQTVLSHRGITLVAGTSAYPVAEIGVARAFADTGDMSNSAEAYRRFLDLWKSSQERNPLLLEARAKAR